MSRWMLGIGRDERTDHVQHLLSDYIDGCLSSRAVRSVEAHLAICPTCAGELEEWRSLLQLVSRHAAVPCPIDCADLVMQRVSAQSGQPMEAMPFTRPFLSFALPSLPARWAALALLLVALLGGWTWMQAFRSPQARTTTVRNGGVAAPLPPTMLHGEAPERLDGAFGRSDSLILASDFAAEE
jgi:anti-sigma factor RsiW